MSRSALERIAAGFPSSLGVVLVLGAATVAWTAPPRPLPAFELVSLEGEATAAASLVQEGRWLLVYVSPHAGASVPLLQALEGSAEAGRPRLVVVVGAERAAALSMARTFEGRLRTAWYADPSGAARRALGLPGVPVVLALQDDSIQWSLGGASLDRRTLRSILGSWR